MIIKEYNYNKKQLIIIKEYIWYMHDIYRKYQIKKVNELFQIITNNYNANIGILKIER